MDIYGTCGSGTFSCGARLNYSDCDTTVVGDHYKFYLSFENSLCTNYITEKLWRVLGQINVIPVVLGSWNYSSHLPKGTYIDVRDFRSPRDLARFLISVDQKDSLYNEYVGRKLSLRCKHKKGTEGHFSPIPGYACRLCRYLHSNINKVSVIPDIGSFWGFKGRCTLPEKYYKGVYDDLGRRTLSKQYIATYLKT